MRIQIEQEQRRDFEVKQASDTPVTHSTIEGAPFPLAVFPIQSSGEIVIVQSQAGGGLLKAENGDKGRKGKKSGISVGAGKGQVAGEVSPAEQREPAQGGDTPPPPRGPESSAAFADDPFGEARARFNEVMETRRFDDATLHTMTAWAGAYTTSEAGDAAEELADLPEPSLTIFNRLFGNYRTIAQTNLGMDEASAEIEAGRMLRIHLLDEIEQPRSVEGRISHSTQQVEAEVPSEILEFNDSVSRTMRGEVVEAEVYDRQRAAFSESVTSDEMLELRRKRFWNSLVRTVGATDYTPPQDRRAVILALGFGEGEDGKVLKEYIGGSDYGVENDNTELIAFDTDSEAVAKARENNSASDTIIEADAADIDQHLPLDKKADVVDIRHPYGSIMRTFLQIGQARLSDTGIIRISLYSEKEDDLMTGILRDFPDLEVAAHVVDPEAIPLRKPLLLDDRYMIVLRKRREQTI